MEDREINLWLLEFLLLHSPNDNAIKFALSLPLPPDAVFPLPVKKLILLRSIEADLLNSSISEALLEYLECVVAIENKLGLPISGSWRDAYCAVALGCTLRHLHGGVEEAMYSAAVQRIWRDRFRKLEGSSIQLITAELLQWTPRLEAALSDETERENLMKIDANANALRLIWAYLDEAYLKWDLSFVETARLVTAAGQADTVPLPSIELAATAADTSLGKTAEVPELDDSADASSSSNTGTPSNIHPIEELPELDGFADVPSSSSAGTPSNIHPIEELPEIDGSANVPSSSNAGTPSNIRPIEELPEIDGSAKVPSSSNAGTPSNIHPIEELPEINGSANVPSSSNAGTPSNINPIEEPTNGKERLKRVLPCKDNQVSFKRRVGGGIKINDAEEFGGPSCCGYDPVPSSLVDKVQGALMSSSLALQAAVQDPLPDAMRVAASLVHGGADTAPVSEPLHPDQAEKDVNATDLSLDKNATDAASKIPGNCEPQPSGCVLPRRSLMERNCSAQTYQWEDSPEGTLDENGRPQLHSPKRLAVSPLRIDEPHMVPHRRRRKRIKRWSAEEEQTLRDGVNRFGKGNWKLILDNYRDILDERTEVDLKDKWRNMTR